MTLSDQQFQRRQEEKRILREIGECLTDLANVSERCARLTALRMELSLLTGVPVTPPMTPINALGTVTDGAGPRPHRRRKRAS